MIWQEFLEIEGFFCCFIVFLGFFNTDCSFLFSFFYVLIIFWNSLCVVLLCFCLIWILEFTCLVICLFFFWSLWIFFSFFVNLIAIYMLFSSFVSLYPLGAVHCTPCFELGHCAVSESCNWCVVKLEGCEIMLLKKEQKFMLWRNGQCQVGSSIPEHSRGAWLPLPPVGYGELIWKMVSIVFVNSSKWGWRP